MPYSVFDSMVHVDEQHGAVSVVSKGCHAAIVIEKLHPDTKELEIRYAHFLPKDKSCNRDVIECLKKIYFHKPAFFINEFFLEPRDGHVECENIYFARDHKKQLSEMYGIDGHYQTYSAQIDLFNDMIKKIDREKNCQDPVSQFQIRGSFVHGGKAHNCHTWVVEKLKMIGIDYKPNFFEETTSAPVSCRTPAHPNNCIIL